MLLKRLQYFLTARRNRRPGEGPQGPQERAGDTVERRALLLCTLPGRQPHLTGPRAAGPGGAWKTSTKQAKRSPRPDASFRHPLRPPGHPAGPWAGWSGFRPPATASASESPTDDAGRGVSFPSGCEGPITQSRSRALGKCSSPLLDPERRQDWPPGRLTPGREHHGRELVCISL